MKPDSEISLTVQRSRGWKKILCNTTLTIAIIHKLYDVQEGGLAK